MTPKNARKIQHNQERQPNTLRAAFLFFWNRMNEKRPAGMRYHPPTPRAKPACCAPAGFFFRSESIRPAKGTQLLRPRRTATHFSADSSQLQLVCESLNGAPAWTGPPRPSVRRPDAHRVLNQSYLSIEYSVLGLCPKKS